MTERIAVYWRQERVGFVNHPSFDHNHIFGIWVPGDSKLTVDFVISISSNREEWVELGEGAKALRALIDRPPEAGEIEFTLFRK